MSIIFHFSILVMTITYIGVNVNLPVVLTVLGDIVIVDAEKSKQQK